MLVWRMISCLWYCFGISTPSAHILRGLIGENPNGIPNNLMPYITQVAVGKLERDRKSTRLNSSHAR